MQKVATWEPEDNPLNKHKPECPFVMNPRISGNIPIQSDIDFQDENTRLETFQNWPLTFITPQQLAKAGFYYINRSDQVKCAWCQGVIGQWEPNDDPLREHLRFFGSCPKARSLDTSNDSFELIPNVVPAKQPKALNYVSLDARLATFNTWSYNEVQSSDYLAEAGFYYLGKDDEVRCFHCDGGLKNWLEDDDPWYEHARWFPKCPFLLLTKGHEFVAQIQEAVKSGQGTPNLNNLMSRPVASSPPQTRVRQPTLTLDEAMSTEAVQTCLAMGLGVGRIRTITKRKLELTGVPYATSQALAEAVLDEQIENECEDDHPTRNPIRNTVSNLLWTAIQQSTASTSNDTEIPIPAATTIVVNRADIETTTPPCLNDEARAPKRDLKKANCGSKDPKELEEENKRLRDARECKICMSNEIGVVFIPCGHLGKKFFHSMQINFILKF